MSSVRLRIHRLALAVSVAAALISGGAALARVGGTASAHGGSRPLAVQPATKLCEPIVFVGVRWQYVGGTINKWFEWSGGWTYGPSNSLIPCDTDILLATYSISPFTTFPFCCAAEMSYAFNWSGVKNTYVVTEPFSNGVGVITSTKRGTKLVETISTEPYTPADVAVAANGTMYVSIVPPQGSSGSLVSCIVVYPPNSSSSAGMLSDARIGTGTSTVAVDGAGDLYVAYTTYAASVPSEQIDEFVKGKGKAVPFATIKGATAGSIAATKKGEVVTSSISGSAGKITIFSHKGGAPIGSFATSSDPGSIGLDKKGDQLIVVDQAADVVESYSFPSGGLISEQPFSTGSSEPSVAASVLLP